MTEEIDTNLYVLAKALSDALGWVKLREVPAHSATHPEGPEQAYASWSDLYHYLEHIQKHGKLKH